MLQDSDEEKLSRIFMILFEKNVAKRSANDFEDSQVHGQSSAVGSM